MKNWIAVLSFLIAPYVCADRLDNVLARVEGTTGGAEGFMAGVTWAANPDTAYYACTERLDLLTLELWLGQLNIARARGVEDRAFLYGTNGPVQVMSYFNAEGIPAEVVFLLLPSGEIHMFRITSEQHIVKASKRWDCSRGEWRKP